LAHNRQIRLGLADEVLKRIFSTERSHKRAARAASLLRLHQTQLTNAVAQDLAMERYSVEQILRMLIERCETFKLYVRGNRRDAVGHCRWMLERIASLYSQGETPLLPL